MKQLFIFALCSWYFIECSSLMANIFRNATNRKAIFVKRLEHAKLSVTPSITKIGLSYNECSKLCLRNKLCKSFNLQLVEPNTCEILDKMVFDKGVQEFYKEDWNNYDPGPVLLPCMARLYNMPEPLSYSVYGKPLTDETADQFCDMKTDGGN